MHYLVLFSLFISIFFYPCFCSSSSFLDLSFLILLWLFVFVYLSVCVFVLSCLLSCFVLPLPRFPGLWPLLPGSSSPLSRVKSLVLWVPTWQLDWCDFWDPLHATGSLSSCLTLPLELPPVLESATTSDRLSGHPHIVLSALPLCLDWFTIHSPCWF